ncbi:MAG TPA: class I SAM-dependent methyltransferase [Bacteroidia bacterium]|nr:class I SAM-dependent methyltransferase [Bacteroidia bacterium]HRG53185.1 class I SAM-dependent methyltransferase [Bacteroidia bacterium]
MIIDKNIFQNPSAATPNFIEDDFSLNWYMTRNERYCFTKLLEKIKPKVSIEIGSFDGGSLQVISKHSEKVYAIDIDTTLEERLKGKFHNVTFLMGDSKVIVPKLLKELQEKGESLEFALIDGDHSALGVKADIENMIKYVPSHSLNIILHDSFNPECRSGMKAVNYSNSKHVHYVELDYITGVFEPNGLKNEMWGGFGHIVLLNEERKEKLEIQESQKKLYDLAYLHSRHFLSDKFGFIKPFIKPFRKK